MKTDAWTLAELAEKAGIPARTIRYYIARGLMEGPAAAGRGALYGIVHLRRLQEIRKLQRDGRMLGEIAQTQVGGEAPAPEAWWRYPIADGVAVEVRGDLAPWRVKRIRKALAQFTRLLLDQDHENQEDDSHGV